ERPHLLRATWNSGVLVDRALLPVYCHREKPSVSCGYPSSSLAFTACRADKQAQRHGLSPGDSTARSASVVALCATTGCAVLAATSYIVTHQFVIELLHEE